MSQVIDIVSLYPKDMNIYGDSGNVLTIQRRLALYGYEPRVHAYNQGDAWPEHVDMILGGGGQDTGQKKIIDDFFKRADLLRSLAAGGTPMLMICGLYQLFGEYFETVDGSRLDGIGVIGAYTVGQEVRMIGNLTEHSADFGDIIGYENHSGQTFLREGVQPLGTVDADAAKLGLTSLFISPVRLLNSFRCPLRLHGICPIEKHQILADAVAGIDVSPAQHLAENLL